MIPLFVGLNSYSCKFLECVTVGIRSVASFGVGLFRESFKLDKNPHKTLKTLGRQDSKS